MGTLHRLFYGVFYQIRWFVSFPVFGVSLTEACPIRFYSENSGCGVRGGVAPDGAINFLWGFCTGGIEMPAGVETVRLPKFFFVPISTLRTAGNTRCLSCGDAGLRKAGNTGPGRQ